MTHNETECSCIPTQTEVQILAHCFTFIGLYVPADDH